jgi:hypothetical protein
MPTRRFKRIALAQLLPSGCAVMFGVCVLTEHAQAQPGYVPPPTFAAPRVAPIISISSVGSRAFSQSRPRATRRCLAAAVITVSPISESLRPHGRDDNCREALPLIDDNGHRRAQFSKRTILMR